MTVAAPAAAPPQQPPPQQLAVTTATALIGAYSVAQAAAALGPLYASAGIERAALDGALRVVMAMPPEQLGAAGPATLNMLRVNYLRRGQFVTSASRRLASDLAGARAHGTGLARALVSGVLRERRFYGQHMDAMYQRARAGAAVDSAAAMYGPLVGWNTVVDRATSPECKVMNGRNFEAGTPPLIGYPGAVHPHCRCWPGPPHDRTRQMLPGPARSLARAGLAA